MNLLLLTSFPGVLAGLVAVPSEGSSCPTPPLQADGARLLPGFTPGT